MHLSYWLQPQRVRSFGFRHWFALSSSVSKVRHHFEHKGDDILGIARRYGVTLNVMNRAVFGFYVERRMSYEVISTPETSLALAVGDAAVEIQ